MYPVARPNRYVTSSALLEELMSLMRVSAFSIRRVSFNRSSTDAIPSSLCMESSILGLMTEGWILI